MEGAIREGTVHEKDEVMSDERPSGYGKRILQGPRTLRLRLPVTRNGPWEPVTRCAGYALKSPPNTYATSTWSIFDSNRVRRFQRISTLGTATRKSSCASPPGWMKQTPFKSEWIGIGSEAKGSLRKILRSRKRIRARKSRRGAHWHPPRQSQSIPRRPPTTLPRLRPTPRWALERMTLQSASGSLSSL